MKKVRKVLHRDCLPTQSSVLINSLVYGLYTKLYNFPLYVDIIVYFLAFCLFVYQVQRIALEDQVAPKDLGG